METLFENIHLIEALLILGASLLCFLIGFILAALWKNSKIKAIEKEKTELEQETASAKRLQLQYKSEIQNKNKEIKSAKNELIELQNDFQLMKSDLSKMKSANAKLIDDNIEKEKQIKEIVKNPSANSDAPLHKKQQSNAEKLLRITALLGEADSTKRQDLKKIIGISDGIENKLNSFGIFNYRQISRINEESKDLLLELMNLSFDKISSNNWVGQAIEMLAKD